MSDDYGNFIQAVGPSAVPAAMAISRNRSFLEGALHTAGGAQIGAEIGGIVARAAPSIAARVAGGAAISAATGAASGAATGAAAGSIVPGVGTVVGAVAGALAPHVLPHIPVVGDAVNKIPLIGGMLSPKKPKTKYVAARKEYENTNPNLSGGSGGNFQAQAASPLQTGAEYSQSNRAEYESGRGFRR